MAFLRTASALVALVALLGCGGDGPINDAAQVRFYNAFDDRSAVRVYINDRAYEADGDSSFDYNNSPQYDDAPSGAATIEVTSSGSTGSNIATLSTSLNEDDHYTLIAETVGGTDRLVLLRDELSPDDNASYVRFVNTGTRTTPLYVQLRRQSDDIVVYQSSISGGLPAGNSTSYIEIPSNGVDSADYELRVYSASGFNDADLLQSQDLELEDQEGKTVLLYNRNDGNDVRLRVLDDNAND